VICRMAPYLVTLNDPNCRKCIRFYWLIGLSCLKIYTTDLCPVFRIGSPTGKDDCCEIGLRSLRDVAMVTCLFVRSTHFCHSDQCVISSVHSATTLSTVVGAIHEVDRRRVRLTTPIHRRFDVHKIGLACWIGQEVQVLR